MPPEPPPATTTRYDLLRKWPLITDLDLLNSCLELCLGKIVLKMIGNMVIKLCLCGMKMIKNDQDKLIKKLWKSLNS